jgi:hypothetical protein
MDMEDIPMPALAKKAIHRKNNKTSYSFSSTLLKT